ncbi:hypothetical protein FHS18_004899 [Paenibacillus phyllosphaerae]|uniref:DUF2512 family protein n=1 Tax=Paenibacillus phyllosphaerae TaxID=274593 RepID=A0A7W5FQ27_9BACL|nr:DUF2512 family protein [Paenibacillus phyllosphaerae]MBB3112797.1 hypothetical protein [Paenibacillus phyllosphaerae]
MAKFVFKWLVNGAIVISLMMYYTEATLTEAAIAATGLTIVAYIIGDQLILRKTNNIVATIVDFGLSAAYLYVVADFLDWGLSLDELFFTCLMLGIFEFVFHRFMLSDHSERERA